MKTPAFPTAVCRRNFPHPATSACLWGALTTGFVLVTATLNGHAEVPIANCSTLDCLPPFIEAVTGMYPSNIVVVRFSEPVDPEVANDEFNYVIWPGDGVSIPRIMDVRLADARTAVVEVDPPLEADADYRFSVYSVGTISGLECGCNFSGTETSGEFRGQHRECVRIVRQPASRTVRANCPASFEVTARWVDRFFGGSLQYQWYLNGGAISGATNRVHTTPPLGLVDQSSRYHVVVRPGVCSPVMSSPALVCVVSDEIHLVLDGARSGLVPNTVFLDFSTECGRPHDRLDPAAATNPLNYTLSGGLKVLGVSVDCERATVRLTTSAQAPGVTYSISVRGIADLAGHVVEAGSAAEFIAPIFVPVPAGRLWMTAEDQQILLEWAVGGILQQAASPGGPWQDVGMATSPRGFYVRSAPCESPTVTRQGYYRVRWP